MPPKGLFERTPIHFFCRRTPTCVYACMRVCVCFYAVSETTLVAFICLDVGIIGSIA